MIQIPKISILVQGTNASYERFLVPIVGVELKRISVEKVFHFSDRDESELAYTDIHESENGENYIYALNGPNMWGQTPNSYSLFLTGFEI